MNEEDTWVEALTRLAKAHAGHQTAGIQSSLDEIRVQLPTPTTRPSMGLDRKLTLFQRDRFTCRYCGRRAILTEVLEALHHLHPDEIPYNEYWKRSECHPVFATHTAVLDHVVPVSRGGSDLNENLVTSCARCNYTKGDYLIEELGWDPPRPPEGDSDWDGLSGLLPVLAEEADLLTIRRFSQLVAAISR